jgi:integrase
MNNGQTRDFCLALLFAETEDAVIELLKKLGYWDNPALWRHYGDRYNEIGRPKSEASERTIPLPPIVVNTLREWRLRCPKRDTGRLDADGNPIWELHLVFPNGAGNIESHINIVKRGLIPTLEAAGVVVPILAEDGRPILDSNGRPKVSAKYTGLHALRHWYASWCINRTADGGLGLPPKTVQARLGHATIGILMDTYGHLFPEGDDATALAEGEKALLG